MLLDAERFGARNKEPLDGKGIKNTKIARCSPKSFVFPSHIKNLKVKIYKL
jgi:hypothetical protein